MMGCFVFTTVVWSTRCMVSFNLCMAGNNTLVWPFLIRMSFRSCSVNVFNADRESKPSSISVFTMVRVTVVLRPHFLMNWMSTLLPVLVGEEVSSGRGGRSSSEEEEGGRLGVLEGVVVLMV